MYKRQKQMFLLQARESPLCGLSLALSALAKRPPGIARDITFFWPDGAVGTAVYALRRGTQEPVCADDRTNEPL